MHNVEVFFCIKTIYFLDRPENSFRLFMFSLFPCYFECNWSCFAFDRSNLRVKRKIMLRYRNELKLKIRYTKINWFYARYHYYPYSLTLSFGGLKILINFSLLEKLINFAHKWQKQPICHNFLMLALIFFVNFFSGKN
jgi:hypothetical protein